MKMRFDRERSDQLETLVTDSGADQISGRNYEADEDLEAAVNVALVLNRPLLVSGAPGCGKTQLGYAIARNLGIKRVYLSPNRPDRCDADSGPEHGLWPSPPWRLPWP